MALCAALVTCPALARADDAAMTPPEPLEEEATYTPISLALVTPAALPPLDPMIIGGLSLNILYGRSRSMFGIEVGAVVNHETDTMGGIQVSPVLNLVERVAGGIQLTSGINYDEGDCHGLVVGGLGTYCGGDGGGIHIAGLYEEVNGYGDGIQLGAGMMYAKHTHFLLQVASIAAIGSGAAVQLAPLGALAEESMDGIQIALVDNVLHDFSGVQIAFMIFDNQTIPVSGGSCGYNCEISVWTEFPEAKVEGVQVAGAILAQNFAGWQTSLANIVARDTAGLQIGAVANAAGNMEGVQLSTLFNWADDLDGLQLSAINVARDVKGLQIGAINVARELTGLQIGVINVAYGNKLPFMVLANAGF